MNTSDRSLETIEISAWCDFYQAARQLPNNPLDARLLDIGGAAVTILPPSNVLAMNRVIGLGLNRPVSLNNLKQIVEAYRAAKISRFFVQLHPEVLDGTTVEVLKEAGLRHYNNWVKLSREATPIETVTTDLTVREIGPNDASAFARIVANAFDWGDSFIAWGKTLVGRPAWRFYMAYDKDEPVATGGFYYADNQAWIDFAATKETHRGRGAQAALLKQRIDDAIELGCKQFVVETAEQTAEKSAPSYRNMLRYGFREAYVRPNYIYEF